jgi:hypothetical protein
MTERLHRPAKLFSPLMLGSVKQSIGCGPNQSISRLFSPVRIQPSGSVFARSDADRAFAYAELAVKILGSLVNAG